ncbi:hypothetical protein B0H10DRAFT_2056325 [Mycena sp. CBHHK59/15]|nr:hypothetical protein B0H10DRAFT_2056325 [Mycena sp. CBHHK59/15]
MVSEEPTSVQTLRLITNARDRIKTFIGTSHTPYRVQFLCHKVREAEGWHQARKEQQSFDEITRKPGR